MIRKFDWWENFMKFSGKEVFEKKKHKASIWYWDRSTAQKRQRTKTKTQTKSKIPRIVWRMKWYEEKKKKKEEKKEMKLYRRKMNDWDAERKMSDWSANFEMNERFLRRNNTWLTASDGAVWFRYWWNRYSMMKNWWWIWSSDRWRTTDLIEIWWLYVLKTVDMIWWIIEKLFWWSW